MTTHTPETEDLGVEELFASVQQQIKDLRHDLEDLKEETRSGEEFKTATAKESLTRLKGLVSQCSGLEKTLVECRQKQRGIVKGGCAFDLDAARLEIGCALNRIRDCRDAGVVLE